MKLRPQKVWLGTHRGIGFKIVNWEFETPMNHWPSGNWNFYIYLPEDKCTDFSQVWLPDEVKEWSAGGRKYVTHDYYSGPVGKIDVHCDVTFYQKHGHVEGHRCVEVGCDYQHLYDEGHEYDEATILSHAVRAINSAFELGILKPEKL